MLLYHFVCLSPCLGCSVLEQKVDLLTEMATQRLDNREDSAQHIKRCLLGWTWWCVAVSPHVTSCVGCSLLEQKIDQMSAEFTRKLQEREDAALQYNRCLIVEIQWCVALCIYNLKIIPSCVGCRRLEEKIKRLTEVTAELMADLTTAVLEGRPGLEGDQAGAHSKRWSGSTDGDCEECNNYY